MIKIRWSEIVIFLCFVVIATVLWYAHAMTSVRNARVPVHITYTGIPERMAWQNMPPETIEIVVRDAGSRLKHYRQDPPQLTIDLSSQVKGERGSIQVGEDQIRSIVTNLLLGTSKLQRVTPENISGEYYRQHEKTVPVMLRAQLTPATEYQFVTVPSLTPSYIKIYGKRAQLDTIEYVFTESATLNGLKDTVSNTLKILPIEGIRMQRTEVLINVIAERFTEKTFTLPVHTTGVPEDEVLHIFPQTVKVTALVSMQHFNDITERDLRAECHYPHGHEQQLEVNIRYHNPHIKSARALPANVEFLIEKE